MNKQEIMKIPAEVVYGKGNLYYHELLGTIYKLKKMSTDWKTLYAWKVYNAYHISIIVHVDDNLKTHLEEDFYVIKTEKTKELYKNFTNSKVELEKMCEELLKL